MTPLVVILTRSPSSYSVNQRLPSGPSVSPRTVAAWLGTGYSVITAVAEAEPPGTVAARRAASVSAPARTVRRYLMNTPSGDLVGGDAVADRRHQQQVVDHYRL